MSFFNILRPAPVYESKQRVTYSQEEIKAVLAKTNEAATGLLRELSGQAGVDRMLLGALPRKVSNK